MSETLDPVATELDQRQLAEQLLAQAKEQAVELVGPNGLLNQLTKNVLETALDAEMAEHLGYDKHDPAGRGSGNSRNGPAETVLTEIGPVEIEVPCDTSSTFDPQIVSKRQRRLTGIDDLVLALDPAMVLTFGDHAYNDGSPSQFANYYDPTWGRFKSITEPSPGNHDWYTAGAAGYEGYFGVQAAAIRSFVVGDWLLVSMDSEKNRASQTTALRSLLSNDGHRCELLYFHHPRYSSGEHGNQPQVEPWWDVADAANVDLILNGHDHSYERFGLIRGIREVVVGTGGVNTRGFGAVQSGSQKRLTGNTNWGVLDLELTASGYTGQFRAATGGTGTVRDSFSGACRS